MAIRLGLPKKARWIDLPDGVKVFVRPLTTAVYETAWAAAHQQVHRLLDAAAEVEDTGAEIEGLPDLTTEGGRAGYANFLFAQALARGAVTKWQGVTEDVVDDDGKPVLGEDGKVLTVPAEVKPASVDELMTWHGQAESFVKQYTQPFIDRIIEGNASGTLPNGTSAGVPKSAGVVH